MVYRIDLHLRSALRDDRGVVLGESAVLRHRPDLPAGIHRILDLGPRLCNQGCAGHLRHRLLCAVRCYIPAVFHKYDPRLTEEVKTKLNNS